MAEAHRYNAACSAALTAAGQGKDEPKPDEKMRMRFRQQALDWLRAELAAAKKFAEANPKARPAVQSALKRWQTDPELTGVREEAAIAKLPADEQAAWRQLWAEVAELLPSEGKKLPATTP